MRIVIIEQDIDVMGGVERIISTLANSFSKDNEVYIISEHKNNQEPFFRYNKNIKIFYLINKMKNNKFNRKNQTFFDKVIDYIDSKRDTFITHFINDEIKEILKKADCIIFGRVDISLKFLPYFEKNGIRCKIIVRDAIHLVAFKDKERLKLKKYFPKNVNTFIVSSNESINVYKKFFGNELGNMCIKKIYNPIGIQPTGEYDYNAKTIVSLGRVEKQKGYEDLIMAFDMIHKAYPDWNLKIYGKGPEEAKLNEIICNLKLNNSVHLMPGTKDVVNVLNKSSIFVMTSRYEGYANMLVEAMSCGMPVITYNWYMGAEDIVENGVNGTIVNLKNRKAYFLGNDNHENVENLAAALEDLVCNREKCEMYSKNAKKILESRNAEKIINKWYSIIMEKGLEKNG